MDDDTARGASPLDGLRVLVVEDEPDAREVLEAVLASAGAEVRAAATVADALSAIAASRPNVLVSDLGIPVLDGYSLIEQVRRAHPDLPAVAVSAFTFPEHVARALRVGFDAFVSKPYTPETLVRIVARLAQGRPAPS